MAVFEGGLKRGPKANDTYYDGVDIARWLKPGKNLISVVVWVPVKSRSPVELTSSIYFFVDATILANTAQLLGKEADFEKYAALAEKIKQAINAKYLNKETAMYAKGTQTELSAPLYWGLVPPELKSKVAANLAKRGEQIIFIWMWACWAPRLS